MKVDVMYNTQFHLGQFEVIDQSYNIYKVRINSIVKHR